MREIELTTICFSHVVVQDKSEDHKRPVDPNLAPPAPGGPLWRRAWLFWFLTVWDLGKASDGKYGHHRRKSRSPDTSKPRLHLTAEYQRLLKET